MKRPSTAIAPYRTRKRARMKLTSRKRPASFMSQVASAALGAIKYSGGGDLAGFISRRFGKRPRSNPMAGVPTMMRPQESGRVALPPAAQFYQAYKGEL